MKKLEEIKLLDIDKVLDEPIPEVRWIVGRMFARGDLVLVYGKSGSMKPILLIDMALHLAAGVPWLGHHINKPTSVQYIDEEMGEIRTRQRMNRIARALLFRPVSGSIVVASYNGMKLEKEDFTTMLKAYQSIYHHLPEVVMIEMVRCTLLGNENNAADGNKSWEAIYPVKAIRVIVIVSHHTRKDSDDVESGSGYLGGGVDTDFSVTKKPKDNVVVMIHQKGRDCREDDDIKVIVTDHGPHDVDPISFRLATEADKKSGRAEEAILEYLLGCPEYTSKTSGIHAHLARLDLSKTTSERVIASLGTRQILYSPGFGEWAIKSPSEVALKDGM